MLMFLPERADKRNFDQLMNQQRCTYTIRHQWREVDLIGMTSFQKWIDNSVKTKVNATTKRKPEQRKIRHNQTPTQRQHLYKNIRLINTKQLKNSREHLQALNWRSLKIKQWTFRRFSRVNYSAQRVCLCADSGRYNINCSLSDLR